MKVEIGNGMLPDEPWDIWVDDVAFGTCTELENAFKIKELIEQGTLVPYVPPNEHEMSNPRVTNKKDPVTGLYIIGEHEKSS